MTVFSCLFSFVKIETVCLVVWSILINCVVCEKVTCGSNAPIVKIEDGKLAGTFYTLPNGKVVTAFLGVPYAQPPTYENRFKVPWCLHE